ncbi:hypothetical protein PH210_13170 [Paenibacillus sp. BSR1-1]|uniref:hypothetical protein n=1 Tax=Paenibacillus sp. BSR1-1 TaxID=3020845 RepID=UPI0025B1FC60|nr:hypothetical protein [Paenibacillus sp. BSR1-1]MDN3017144.1 hypothetical protein [Paenibacillus sp. BSR1-1]
MLEENKKITYSGEEIIEVLKEIELIRVSLAQMGSYYGSVKGGDKEENKKKKAEYEKEIPKFIDRYKVYKRLAKASHILSLKFDDTLGNDDMGDLERAMEGLKYWTKPNDKP